MSSVTLQNLTSRFTPQQIVAMVNAQMAANANANANVMAQSYASNQPHALNQVQAGSQFQAVAQPQDMNNHSWKGKARAKGLKFHSVHANSKKKGALANPAMKLKKNSRPLNSFMAFRSYYSKIFKGFQQKNISGLLTALWKADPFKAKWAILAKGFSEIRDGMGKSDAHLPQFLDINAPLLRIIEPERYLEILGWELSIDAEAKVILLRANGFDDASVGSEFLATTVSVAEVVENSYEKGYIARDGDATVLHSKGQVMIMASSAQPATPAATNDDSAVSTKDDNNDLNMEQQLSNISTEDTGDADFAVQDVEATTPEGNSSTNIFGDMSSSFGNLDAGLSGDAADAHDDDPATVVDYAPVAVDFNMVDQHVGAYPHNLAFDPCAAEESFMFDPFNGNGFDAFNMSNVEMFDMNDWLVAPNGGFDDEFFGL